MQASANKFPQIAADTLPKCMRLGVQRWGDKVYMRRKDLGIWQRYTWQDVYDQVKAFCLGLINLGLERGETVGIIGENTPELFWADFATLAAGAKMVCLYPDMTPDEMLYVLQHSEAVFLVAEDQEQVDKYLEIRSQLPNIRKVIYWDERGMWQYHEDSLIEFKEVIETGRKHLAQHPDLFEQNIDNGQADDVAMLSYTSGTTGIPKGVVLTHKWLLDHAYRLIMANEFKPFTQYLSYLSPAWVTEHFFVALGLLVPFVYNFPEEPETVLANIRELGAECLVFGPRQWESLASTVQVKMNDAGPIRRSIYKAGIHVGMKLALERTGGPRAGNLWHILYPIADQLVLKPVRDNLGLRKCYFACTGGAPAAPEIFNLFHAMGVKLRNIYGSTEMGLFTQHMGDRFDPATLGQWFQSHPELGPPLEWKIDDDGGLLVRGGSFFCGYHKDPSATGAALKDGWFVTGDAIKMQDDGELVFLDRVKDLKRLSTGHLFPPQFIETRLRFSPYIKDAMILGDEHKDSVAAFINIDAETVGQWAEREGIPYSSFPDLSQKPQVCDLIQKEVDRVNDVLDPQSQVKHFVNLPKELDPDEAELTRTRKLRRGLLEERYNNLILAIYSGNEMFETEVPVKYRDGRTGMVKTLTRINAAV
ncbi:AMP-binding protein [Olavius sp. associated proteobacterium Delta 1]|nr:AMP-binding protein [Olavius sp. associated proteobacterium Delta 1]